MHSPDIGAAAIQRHVVVEAGLYRPASCPAHSEHRNVDEVGDPADGGAEGEMVGERGLRETGCVGNPVERQDGACGEQ